MSICIVHQIRIAEAAEIFVKAPNDFTMEILTDSLVKS